jgi:hypothetical protein
MIFEHQKFLVLFAGLFASVIAASCLEVSPIVVASSTNAANQSRECAACYTAPNDAGRPGCANEVTACYAVEKCKEAFDCSIEHGCFQGAREDLITCGQACASEAGFTSLSDTPFGLATNVYACLLGPCKDACFGSADGGTEDASVDAAAEAATICGAPNAQNNELGFGGYCKSTSECRSEAGLRLCAADFGGGNFCTGPCTLDEECGSGAHCAHAAQGSGCVPLACQLPTGAGPAD